MKKLSVLLVGAMLASSFLGAEFAFAKIKIGGLKPGICAQRLQQAKTKPGHFHALAQSSVDANGRFSCTLVLSEPTKAAAINKALKACNKHVRAKSLFSKGRTCRIVFVK